MSTQPFHLADHVHVVERALDWLDECDGGGDLPEVLGTSSVFCDEEESPQRSFQALKSSSLPFFDHSNTQLYTYAEVCACVAMCFPEWQAGMRWGGWGDNLFDASGLRRALRAKGIEGGNDTTHGGLIVALDEEPAYCSLLAYTAYRNGYRALAVCRDAQLDELRVKKGEARPKGLSVAGFVDIGLRFPDSNQLRSVPDVLENTILDDAQVRVCAATAGASDAFSDKRINTANQAFVANQSRVVATIHKPIGGIYQIAREGLRMLFGEQARQPKSEPGRSQIKAPPHSADGMRQFLASRMIARGQRLLEGAKEPLVALKAAVLALDARALLRGGTETLQVESLLLQHQAEVTAECLFPGVGRDLNAKERLKEAAGQVKSAWRANDRANRRSRRRAAFSSIVLLADRLRSIYDRYGHYYSAGQCLNVSRDYHRKLRFQSMHPAKYWGCLGWAANVCQWYYEYLIGHLWVFALAVVAGTTLTYSVMAAYSIGHHPGAPTSELDRIMHAFKSFTTAGMRYEWVQPGWPAVAIAALALLGGVHWAFFISHLYARLARK